MYIHIVHKIEHYSAVKRKETLMHGTMWMNLEDIILNEISQSQKDKHCMRYLGKSKS